MAQFTQREFLYLDDLLHLEELQAVVATHAAAYCSDPQISRLCVDIARRSEQHFNTLLNYLNQSQGRSFAQPAAHANFSTSPAGYTFGQ